MGTPTTGSKTQAREAYDSLAPALAKQISVMWRCSCGEMWAGTDMERDAHRHGAYEAGVHRVTGPIFRDAATETTVRDTWAKEDANA